MDENSLNKVKNAPGIYSVEVRCVRVDGKHLYEPTWPDYAEFHLNGKKLNEFKPLQSNSSLKKRKDEKYSINEANLLRVGTNTV